MVIKNTNIIMRSDRLVDFREVANARVSARLKQVFILVGTIVLGMLISVSINS